MRNVLRFVLPFLVALGAAQAFAAPADGEKPAAQDDAARIDTLFGELKRERNEKAAQRIADRIWQEWMKSGSASIDLMMQWSNEATQKKEFSVALDFLDQIVLLQPGYAEGWNRRATVHFMMDSYSKSMADIERTLRLEPRHFGALSGMGAILKATGRKHLALNAYERVLDIYPMMRNAQTEVVNLTEELAGEGI
ncbi:hypothetical protein FQ775_06365 [Nitratireductor mangrovi]|uniref:Uncharacterized protein n=1 Tax=Nitratireductor mangrovi TaxID=2599600 RepID=A0A5B8KWI9_9HYPH|nr:hypothetical protein [Nitratireductor mangrovi]MEC9343265.1 hypothetical protein [Pseudomonadota bacterium]QDZ00034.1 hypothetical protein FQ775_06365 [Nitratireductor mangrovi]